MLQQIFMHIYIYIYAYLYIYIYTLFSLFVSPIAQRATKYGVHQQQYADDTHTYIYIYIYIYIHFPQ